MNAPPIVSPKQWEAAREQLLVKEKELTRAHDALAAERRRMPRMAVEKEYAFEGPDGPATLLDQVAHLAHLNARDTTYVRVSRAPQSEIQRYQARMGWDVPWYTLTDDFDKDFGVDEWHGHNAFIREGDEIFRTYFINGRGDEHLGTTWSYLDMTALGRQEEWEDSPEGSPQTPPYQWWNLHDQYDRNGAA
jgi:predicted dithiol-disulfide oxidoreductase (DUF899 family)